MPLDCGIDIGSTNLKVVLVNEAGRTVHVRSVPSPREDDGIGSVTDALALVDCLETLIIEGWTECGGGEPLRSIAAAGVGEDGVGVDAQFRPTGFAIPWFDRRAVLEARALNERGDVWHRTGNAIEADRTVAKWAWLRNHRPDELDHATHWIALTDFPAAWWSGEPFMSASLAPRTSCFDLVKREWIEDLLEYVGAPQLPKIAGGGVPIGSVRKGRLREAGAASDATIVAAGGHDHPVSASIIRRHDPQGIVDSLGTANLLYGELPAGRALLPSPGLAYSLPPGGGETLSCLGVIELSAALRTFREEGDAFWAFLGEKRLPGRPPSDVRSLDSEASSIRRVLEDLTLKAGHLLKEMQAAGVSPGPIYTSGGWSRSHGFTELRASVFGQPIHVVKDMEVAAVGAAQFGALAAAGQVASPVGPEDIYTVEPVAEWAIAYDRLSAERHGAQASGQRGDAG
jgi:xylulokinase